MTRPFFFFDFFDLTLPALQPAFFSAFFAAASFLPTSFGTTQRFVATAGVVGAVAGGAVVPFAPGWEVVFVVVLLVVLTGAGRSGRRIAVPSSVMTLLPALVSP